MRIIVSYRGIPQSPGWATGDYMVQALRQLGHDAVPYGNYYQTTEWMGRDTSGADLLLWMECNDQDRQYVELLDLQCRKVFWDFDTAMHLDHSLVLAAHFDRVYLANPALLHHFPGAKYLPYAADPVRFGPTSARRSGVAIIGTPFSSRVAFAAEAGIHVQSGLFRHDYVKALGSLQVSVHHTSSGGAGLLVMRIWETMACGTCLLTERDQTIGRHFMEDRHFVAFSDADEARKKIAWLLESGKWQSIGQVAREEILMNHTYHHRARTILEGL